MPGPGTPLGSWASGKPPVFNCTSMLHVATIITVINHQATQSLREKATNVVKQKRSKVTTSFSNLLLFLYYEWHQQARQPWPQYLAGVTHQLWTARGISYHSQSSNFSIVPQPASSDPGESRSRKPWKVFLPDGRSCFPKPHKSFWHHLLLASFTLSLKSS